LLLWTNDVVACQVASAITSLREALKVSPLCLQRTLDPKKISALALNCMRPGHGTSLIRYLGAVVMPRCSSRAQSLPVRTGASAPKDFTSFASWYILSVSRGRVLFIGFVFYVMVLRLLLLLNRRALSRWTLRDHQLYHKRFLLL
jgi:hypothetical protein